VSSYLTAHQHIIGHSVGCGLGWAQRHCNIISHIHIYTSMGGPKEA